LPPKGPTTLFAAWPSPQTRKNPAKRLSYRPKLHRNVVGRTVRRFQIGKRRTVRPTVFRWSFVPVSAGFGYWYDTQGVVSCNLFGGKSPWIVEEMAWIEDTGFWKPNVPSPTQRLDLKCQKLPKRRVTSCFRVSFMCKSMN
jgi:hypothetical protein